MEPITLLTLFLLFFVQDVTYLLKQLACANCHGIDDDEIMATQGRVP